MILNSLSNLKSKNFTSTSCQIQFKFVFNGVLIPSNLSRILYRPTCMMNWWSWGLFQYIYIFFCISCCVIVFEHSCQSLSENSYPISRSRKILIHSEIGFMQLEILVRNKILHFSLKMMPVILDILYVAILNFSDPHALTYYSWYSILKSSIKIPK